MKKNKALLILTSTLLLLTGCKGDPRFPRKFKVNFVTGETGEAIPSQNVKEGYTIELTKQITNPNNTKEHIFRGWYSSYNEETNTYDDKFDIENYRIFGDTTLYAKWSFPTDQPSEFAIGEGAFSKTVKWIQKGVDNNTVFSISLTEGERKPIIEHDPIMGEDVTVGYYIDYEGHTPFDINGTYSVSGYEVSFTTDYDYGSKYYRFSVSTNGGAAINFNDIQFKGSGTKDDPFRVYTEDDLKYLTVNDISEDVYVEMKNNVTIHSLYSEKIGKTFNGHFDGKDYSITLKNNSGLFYKIGPKGNVANIKFNGAISGSDPSIGVVANYNEGTIKAVNSEAVSVSSQGGAVNKIHTVNKGGVGGIVGTNLEKGLIEDVSVSSSSGNTIQGNIAVGGVAGINYGTIQKMTISAIVGAYNGKEASNTIGNSFAGVVVGINYGKVLSIDVDGKINCRRIEDGKEGDGATNIGGVVGYNADTGLVDGCIFQGMRCVGDTNVGGIVGYNDGTITNCLDGRRLRKPSNTTIEERQFIVPVIGSYNVGGIAGYCTNNSVITNVFSTANVWSYKTMPYSVSSRASNAISIKYNFQSRLASNYLGRTYGEVISNTLTAPKGENLIEVDNAAQRELRMNYLLGQTYEGAIGVRDQALIDQYLAVLGDRFTYNSNKGIYLK